MYIVIIALKDDNNEERTYALLKSANEISYSDIEEGFDAAIHDYKRFSDKFGIIDVPGVTKTAIVSHRDLEFATVEWYFGETPYTNYLETLAESLIERFDRFGIKAITMTHDAAVKITAQYQVKVNDPFSSLKGIASFEEL